MGGGHEDLLEIMCVKRPVGLLLVQQSTLTSLPPLCMGCEWPRPS